MATALLDDPALTMLLRRLKEMCGPRLARAVLFGSRARGDHRADLDRDVAVFLTSLPDRWAERKRLAHLRVDAAGGNRRVPRHEAVSRHGMAGPDTVDG